ncbi:helix-turn-helix domain-containing protein [Aromatoleum evansii]|uniref:Helix-turn-helix domain-containing protein n=1 Tax=Aromatoleum evansii TaxID=59406 RepID=A0ABZ1AGG2_AROEV|nr:helix-turn-helix domain-containing protein [Aromatoleum evansii]
MKYDETPMMTQSQVAEAKSIGEKLARLRLARRLRQSDAAARAGMSRSTAALIERGDPGRTLAQVLRYLGVVAPGLTLLALLQEEDPSLHALAAREITKRARPLSEAELRELDFRKLPSRPLE